MKRMRGNVLAAEVHAVLQAGGHLEIKNVSGFRAILRTADGAAVGIVRIVTVWAVEKASREGTGPKLVETIVARGEIFVTERHLRHEGR